MTTRAPVVLTKQQGKETISQNKVHIIGSFVPFYGIDLKSLKLFHDIFYLIILLNKISLFMRNLLNILEPPSLDVSL